MAATTGALYHYQDPLGRAVLTAQLDPHGKAAYRLRCELGRLGLDEATVVTDIGDELVGRQQVKLIEWVDRDGLPQVTSIGVREFCDNFRRVASG